MDKIENPDVKRVFNAYPKQMRTKLMALRQLVLDTASKSGKIEKLEESLKWGEPSYLAKGGSTLRMAWKQSSPDTYSMYFNCNTRLVDTFKELYKNKFNFKGNREIAFYKNDKIPTKELSHCILLTLTYHKIKHLPLLGA